MYVSLSLFFLSLLRWGRRRRTAKKRNPFARNGRRASKTEVKLWFSGADCNHFARNGRRTSKTEVKLWFWGANRNPFARNGRRTSKTKVKLWFSNVGVDRFARNGRRTWKTDGKNVCFFLKFEPFCTKRTPNLKNWGKSMFFPKIWTVSHEPDVERQKLRKKKMIFISKFQLPCANWTLNSKNGCNIVILEFVWVNKCVPTTS